MKSKKENKDFYSVLYYYLELIRGMHKKRIDYVGKATADSNPIMFTQGGAYGGNLKPNEQIKPLLKSSTVSFGITALHELTLLHSNKKISEDNSFAVETMKYINSYVEEIKKKDNILYAIYGSPAESLCGLQVRQFREKFGVIKNVSDKDFFSNSFHCYVGDDISPIDKQDKEFELFNLIKGGHIQYVKMNNPSNIKALKNIILRGLEMGFYQGINFNACFCEDCGNDYNGEHGEDCPKCNSSNISEQNRISGYLGFTRRGGDRTINDDKYSEIKERVSM